MNLRLDLEPQSKYVYAISYFDPIKKSKSTICRDSLEDANSLASILYRNNYISIEMYQISVEVIQVHDYLEAK